MYVINKDFNISTNRSSWFRGSVPSSHARRQWFQAGNIFTPTSAESLPNFNPAFLLSASHLLNWWPSVWFSSLSPLTAKWQATSAAEPNLRVRSTQFPMVVIRHTQHLFTSFQHSLLDGAQGGSHQLLGTPSNNFYTQNCII